MLKLMYRRKQHLLSYMYDWSLDPKKLKGSPVEGVITRSRTKKMLKIRKPKTEKFRKSIGYHGPNAWNKLSKEIQMAPSKGSFKSLVEKWVTKRAESQYRSENNSAMVV